MHSYQDRTSLLSHKDGLSSDQVEALFEDREGTIWVATADGLDRFRELPVRSLSDREGLSSAIYYLRPGGARRQHMDRHRGWTQ